MTSSSVLNQKTTFSPLSKSLMNITTKPHLKKPSRPLSPLVSSNYRPGKAKRNLGQQEILRSSFKPRNYSKVRNSEQISFLF